MPLDIFEFKIADYKQVVALWKRCEGIGLSNADSFNSITAYLRRNPGMSFIARHNNRIVGAVLCGHDGRRGYLHHLAVDPQYRHQGIGRSLVEKCLSVLNSVGIQKCHLFIFHHNKQAMRFWEKIGWTQRIDISVVSKEIP